MDVIRGQDMDLRSQKGQTMVEYMLLLVVSVSIVMTFLNSSFFRRVFGQEGAIATTVKAQYEWGYRHAYLEERLVDGSANPPRENTDGRSHPSYYHPNGETRFFGPTDAYPE
jgi:hypothetical protein